MTTHNRLIKIQASLTPKQAVLLLISEAQKTGSLQEYASKWLKLPLAEFPRSRINRQVAIAVRTAMKDQSRELVEKAVRAAAMEADFLMVLFFAINEAILNDTECRQLRLQLLQEQVLHRGESWTDAEGKHWVGRLLLAMAEVLVLRAVVEWIEREHFCGNQVLFSDAAHALEEEFRLGHEVFATYDRVVAGCPNSSVDLGPVSDRLKPLIPFRASRLVAKAKSDMLREFTGHEAAVPVMRRYF